MDLASDLDTLDATVHTGKARALYAGFAGFGTLFVGIGAAFGTAAVLTNFSDPAFPFLGACFALVGAIPALVGSAGVIAGLRRIHVRMEIHEVDIEVHFAGVRIQHVTARLSELEEVELDAKALRLRGPGIAHAISMKNVSPEDAEALRTLLSEAVRQRDESTRQPPAELLRMIRGRASASP